MDSSTNLADEKQKEEIVNRIRQQVMVANVQEILQNMSEKCLNLCLRKPGKRLEGSEQKCLGYCVDRYLETMSMVANSYRKRLQEQ